MPAKNYRSLKKLFSSIPVEVLTEVPDIFINGITLDSREVKPGNIFIALAGDLTDGHQYIPQAIKNGAVAVMGNRADMHPSVPYIQVKGDTKHAMAYLAAALHDFPARKLTVIGVTGTDGKTTTTTMIHQILTQAGVKAGMISTVSAVIGNEELDTGFHVTTPESPAIQAYLAQMVQAGMTHVVLETTSHGLVQERVTACDYDLGVLTNVTHEHLDFHGSYEAYLEAKGRLFEMLKQTPKKHAGNLRTAILNKDDRSYEYMKRVAPEDQLSYSMVNEGDIWADEIENTPEELRFTCHYAEHAVKVRMQMIGLYNVSNALAAIAATVLRLGVPIATALEALAVMPGVPGRMQRITLGQDFTAIVDFAHTPNALQRALETVKELTKGRVIAVFGSAGLRDREKRRMMPRVSIENADLSILTAEDPRTEALDDILAEMAGSAIEAGGIEGRNFWCVPDRGEAIRLACQMAQPGDLVIACGKGHEQSMCFGTTEYLWDDRVAMRSALSGLLKVPGPEMPYLPTRMS
jgi:UDP-N-acetylmuramoyl-L-alanyl-D-glutamate--2,6-diaminopimelate ligase